MADWLGAANLGIWGAVALYWAWSTLREAAFVTAPGLVLLAVAVLWGLFQWGVAIALVV